MTNEIGRAIPPRVLPSTLRRRFVRRFAQGTGRLEERDGSFTDSASLPVPSSPGEKGRKYLLLGIVLVLFQNSFAAAYQELNAHFKRSSSHVTIRKIAKPTLANLDFAAYDANPVRQDPQVFTPRAPVKKIGPQDCAFGGLLSHQCATLQSTPLTPEEIQNPMAWEPLAKKIWEQVKSDAFTKIGGAISAEKWADPSVFMPYQRIAAAYVHGSGDSASFWVKIEFEPWVGFLKGAGGGDKDGYKEIYGKLALSGVDKKIVAAAIDWIKSDYAKKELSREEIIDWANILASYWYPKFNTDIVDTTGQTMWPGEPTEDEIKKELSGQPQVKPLIIIRGNPFGEVMYNIYVIDLSEQPAPSRAEAVSAVSARDTAHGTTDTARSHNFILNSARFEKETMENGDYPGWSLKIKSVRKDLAALLMALPRDKLSIEGKDGWLFFRSGIDYVLGGDLTIQPADKNPLPRLVEFQKYLSAMNVPLLFVMVPDKAEVYFDKLPIKTPEDVYSIVNPYARKFLRDAQEAGIEVVDLLPLFLAAKRTDAKGEGLFQKQDTHWSTQGLLIAAQAISERIRLFGWYREMKPVRYSTKDTVIQKQGDLVDKLAEADRTKFPPVSLEARQVLGQDNRPYKPNDGSAPILLIGDSFTGVFEIIDCKGAGVGAHIAQKTGVPVEVITSWGGGPLVRDKLVRVRQKVLAQKRVVIYLMAARDLYNYSQGWLPLTVK